MPTYTPKFQLQIKMSDDCVLLDAANTLQAAKRKMTFYSAFTTKSGLKATGTFYLWPQTAAARNLKLFKDCDYIEFDFHSDTQTPRSLPKRGR